MRQGKVSVEFAPSEVARFVEKRYKIALGTAVFRLTDVELDELIESATKARDLGTLANG